jgi:hypothetical protein
MATEIDAMECKLKTVTINKREALDLITFLSSQLSGMPIRNNSRDEIASVDIFQNGSLLYKLSFIIW